MLNARRHPIGVRFLMQLLNLPLHGVGQRVADILERVDQSIDLNQQWLGFDLSDHRKAAVATFYPVRLRRLLRRHPCCEQQHESCRRRRPAQSGHARGR